MSLFLVVCNREAYLMRHIDIYYDIESDKIHSISFTEMKKAMQMLWMQYRPWPKAKEAAALGAKLD